MREGAAMTDDVIPLHTRRESDEDFARNRVADMLRGHCDLRRIVNAQAEAARRVRMGWNRGDAVQHAVEWALSPRDPEPLNAA